MNSGDNSESSRGRDQLPSSRPPDSALTPAAGVRCPQCGSARIRPRTRPLAINAIACAVTLLLTPLNCAMALGVLISFMALPFTVCVAVVGSHRCRDCGRRFTPDAQAGNAAGAPRFPWRFHILNAALLFLLCVVGPHVLRARAGAGGLPDVMASMGFLFRFGFFLWVCLIYHLIVYHLLKPRVVSPWIWAALFLLPGAAFGGMTLHKASPSRAMQTLFKYAYLAPLPDSATGVRYYSWSSPFSGEDFMRFTADANDIQRFLADSPALWGQEPEQYSTRRMRLKYPTDENGNMMYPRDGNEYIIPRSNTPSWYMEEIRGPTRKYKVQPPRYQFPGEVLIDDETNTVYIYFCFS
jgi:hypothetical protein